MAYASLDEIAVRRFLPPKRFDFVPALGQIPLAFSEMHLSAFYYVVAVRFRGDRPELCALVGPDFLSRPLVNAEGDWLGGYLPIALRTHPFRLAEAPPSGDPLRDLEADLSSPCLVTSGGAPLREDGQPSATVQKIHGLLTSLRDSRRGGLAALDRLFLADLMVPLRMPAGSRDPGGCFIVDRARFARMSPRALRAMARQDFHSVEIATACIFSQRLLNRDLVAAQVPEVARPVAETATPKDYTPFWTGLDQLPAVLDEDELFSLDDMADFRLDERPA